MTLQGLVSVCYEMNVFLRYFPKIHRSALRKLTINLLYFWDVYDVNLWGKIFGKSTAYAEQMYLYNFVILRRKADSCGICETFKKSGGCFWKHITYYYVGHKLAIFNAVLFTLLHLLLTRWWDMRLKHDVAWLWEEQADSRNECQNKKKYCSCCITWIKNWYHFIKNIYNFQNLLFRKLLAQLGNQTDIFWKFYSPADILWSPKTVGRVLGYTTGSYWEEIEYFLLNSILSTN